MTINDEVHEEIAAVIKNKNDEILSLPASDFRRVFWDQQVYNYYSYCFHLMRAKQKTGIRWHALFILWCLNLSRISPKAYEVMRESGLELPIRRTLNDYGCRPNLVSITKLICS